MDKDKFSAVSAIALNTIFGNDPKFSHNIIDALGSTEAVFSLSKEETDRLFGPFSRFSGKIGPQALEQAEREYEQLSAQGVSFLSIFDPGYPSLLRECPDAPVLLYVRSSTDAGRLFNSRPAISVVGTRDISLYGKEWCTRIVRTLASAPEKPMIVSGLAIGVDITAQMAAIASGLPTIGVSPVGIDSIYPARHRVAADKIENFPGGAVITDYPPGTSPMPYNFLRRNRIIAGLSSATILIESKIKGGGMMTARLASGYGRDVFALPGRIDDIRSQGCNHLLREKIAEPVSDVDALPEMLGLGRARIKKTDVEEAAAARFSSLPAETLSGMTKILRAIKEERGIDHNMLCAVCDLDYNVVSYITGLLQSEGIIETDILGRCCINPKF